MNLGSILSTVAGIALIATGSGAGVVAGAMLLVGGLAAGGVIGGSVGKFMNSGIGRGLMATVALGSMAYAAYGQSPAQAGAQQAAQTGQAAMSAAPIGAAGANLDDASAALTHVDLVKAAGMGQEVTQMGADPSFSAVSGVDHTSQMAMNTTGEAAIAGPGANASGAAAQATDAATKAVQPGGSAARGLAGPQAPAGAGDGGGGAPAPGPVPPAAASTTGTPSDAPYQVGDSAPGAAPSGGGFMSKAADLMDTRGAGPAMQGVGSLIGGIGSGIAQKQAMEDQIKAQQWGNMQWQNQGQVDKMQAAAAQPITVPQGYLQRAQQVRTLMQGGQGMQPLPTAQPGAPLAPSPLPPGH
jgi:hypothetical protein